MIEAPILAVVFGTYNRLEHLKKAVASVRIGVNHGTSYVMIVVDGGSTDGSREWLAVQPDVVLIGQRGSLTGAVDAFNLGFGYAVGHAIPYVAHLNDDAEIVTTGALSIAIERLQEDPKIGEVAFAFDLYAHTGTQWSFDHVNGKPYANFGVIRREAGMAVARAQGDESGRQWWNPIYKTYGADSEFGVWLWKLGWRVVTAGDLCVHDAQAMDALREGNDALNPDRADSKLFWSRWRDETFDGTSTAAVKPWTGLHGCTALVTGGEGFLGRRVQSSLLASGCKVVHGAYGRKHADLRQLSEAMRLFHDAKPDLVVHCAATVGGIGANQARPADMFADNTRMGLNVLEAARLVGVSKVVMVGTTCSYPAATPIPFNELTLFNGFPEATNAAYGIAKRGLIVAAGAYRKQHGLNVVTVIPANLYGPGDNFDLETSHVIPAIIRKIDDAKRAGASTVQLWGDGTPTREFLYVDDAGRGIARAADCWNRPVPVNLGPGDGEHEIRYVATMIANLMNYEGNFAWDASQPNGQMHRSLDVSRAAGPPMNFVASVALAEGLCRTIDWYQERLR